MERIDIFEDYSGRDRNESDEHYRGWIAAKQDHDKGIDVSTHRSHGDSEFDKGWNDYIDQIA